MPPLASTLLALNSISPSLLPCPLLCPIHSYTPPLCLCAQPAPIPHPFPFLPYPSHPHCLNWSRYGNKLYFWVIQLKFYVIIHNFKSQWAENFTFTDRDWEIGRGKKEKEMKGGENSVFQEKKKVVLYRAVTFCLCIFSPQVHTRKECRPPPPPVTIRRVWEHREPWAPTVGPEHRAYRWGQETLPHWARVRARRPGVEGRALEPGPGRCWDGTEPSLRESAGALYTPFQVTSTVHGSAIYSKSWQDDTLGQRRTDRGLCEVRRET